MTLHRREAPVATPKKEPEAELADRAELVRVFEREAVRSIPWWRRSDRTGARLAARSAAKTEADARDAAARESARSAQTAADAEWDRLLRHDPSAVEAAVVAALEGEGSYCPHLRTKAFPAGVISICGFGPEASLISEVEVTTTAAGNPTVRKRSKTSQNEDLARILASLVVAQARLVFAASPGSNRVILVLLSPSPNGAEPDCCLAWGDFERAKLDGVEHALELDTESFRALGGQISLKGRMREVVPSELPTNVEPHVADLRHDLARFREASRS